MANVTPVVLDYRANDNATKTIEAISNSIKKNKTATDALLSSLRDEETLRKKGRLAMLVEKATRDGATLSQRKEIVQRYKAIEATKQHTQANGALTQQMRQLRGMAGQLGYQVQDVAVQMQMGTDAMIILGQQGGQVLSVFGGWGAVAGAVISVGSALYTYIQASESAGASTQELKTILDKYYNAAIDAAEADKQMTSAKRELLTLSTAIAIQEEETAYKKLQAAQKQAAESIIEANQRKADADKMAADGVGLLTAVYFRLKQMALDPTEESYRELGLTIAKSGVAIAQSEAQTDKLTKRLKSLEDGTYGVTDGINSFDDAMKNAKELNKFLDAFEEQANTIGKTKRELALYQAAQMRLGAEDIEFINAQFDKIEAYEAEQEKLKEQDRLKKQAEAAQKREIDNLNNLITKLNVEAATYGQSEAAALEYRLGLDGVISEKDREAIAIQKTVDKLNEEKKKRDDLAKKAKEEERARKADIESRKKMVDKLKVEAETYGMSEAAVLAYKLGLDGVIDAQELEAISLQIKVDELEAEAEARKKAAKAAEEHKKMVDNFNKSVDYGPTAMEVGVDFEALQDSFKTELELFREQQKTKLELVNEHEQNVNDVLVNYSDVRKRIAQETADFEQAAMLTAANAVLGSMQQQVGQLSGLFDQATGIGKAFYVLNQTMSAGMAIINGYVTGMALKKNHALLGDLGISGEAANTAAVAMGYATAGAIMGQTLASFEGGGFTGTGVRSGGMDGKGGRLAVVHPNEKITDLEKGKSSSAAPVNVSLNISAVDTKGFDKLLAEKQGMIVSMINRAVNDAGRRSLA